MSKENNNNNNDTPIGLKNPDKTTCWLNCLIQILWIFPEYRIQFQRHLPLRTAKMLEDIYTAYEKRQVTETAKFISLLKHQAFPSFWSTNEEQDVNDALFHLYSQMNEQQHYCFEHLGVGSLAFDQIHHRDRRKQALDLPSYCKSVTLTSSQNDLSHRCHAEPLGSCQSPLFVGSKLWYIQTSLCIQQYLYRVVVRRKEVFVVDRSRYSTVITISGGADGDNDGDNIMEILVPVMDHIIQITLTLPSYYSLEEKENENEARRNDDQKNPTDVVVNLDTLIDNHIRVFESGCVLKAICDTDQKLYEYEVIMEQTFLVHKNLPLILPIVLLRNGGQHGKYHSEINMPLQYNFYRLFHPSVKNKRSDFIYDLCGFIRHLGEGTGTKGGHYVCFIKIPSTQKWYMCNDTRVNEISVTDVEQHAKSGYSYFYKRVRT
jgi:Ubiquitin carboxyl-terminal hydrolase